MSITEKAGRTIGQWGEWAVFYFLFPTIITKRRRMKDTSSADRYAIWLNGIVTYRRYWEYRETPQLPVISWFSDHVPYLCWRIFLSAGESEKIYNPQTDRRIAWWTDRWRTQNHSRNDWRYHEIQGDGKQIGFSFSFSSHRLSCCSAPQEAG